MRRLLVAVLACALALVPSPVRAYSVYGSPAYGDPPGWCTNFSDMWIATVATNDPLVAANPERDTFYGFHKNPGYDDWYGFFYGDFRGTAGDASGWVSLLHETYPHHYHWNFGDFGWAVHGHVKEYIAYYNWTFGGQCGIGVRGRIDAPPFMADQYGYPVVDIYVDTVAPYPPQPRVRAIPSTSVSFPWDPVADRGDGAGRDYFVAGMDHYVSWLTVDDRPGTFQLASTPGPRTLVMDGLRPLETACVHVQAVDRVQNATADQVACSGPLTAPPMPEWSAPAMQIDANPASPGLAGFESWFWLAQAPSAMAVTEEIRGVLYTVTATPVGADWDFGDGTTERFVDALGFGEAYPSASSVAHVYQAFSRPGYAVRASVRYQVTWSATVGGSSFGPFPLDTMSVEAPPLQYSVQQAQPELVAV
jgi:hypothetical protein